MGLPPVLLTLLVAAEGAAESAAPAAEGAASAAGTAAWGAGVLGVLGAALGLLLFVASRKFAVQTDPRVDAVLAALPGANCGGCSFPGCAGYAEAVVLAGAPVDRCAPGGAAAARQVAAVMGVSFEASDRKVSVLACRGARGFAPDKYAYSGVEDCRAAALLHDGPKGCRFGCLGFGTCAQACPFDALVMGPDGLPHVVEELCTGCGKCVTVCPRNLFALRGEKQTVAVACASHDPGKIVNRVCKVGCIACRRCEKACKFDAIHVTDNLATIDYDKCRLCGACVKACPRGIIVNFRQARRERRERLGQPAAAPAARDGA